MATTRWQQQGVWFGHIGFAPFQLRAPVMGKKPHGFKTKHRMANKLLRINGLALSKVMCHVDWDAMWECSCSCQLEMTCCKRWDYGDKEPCSLDPCFVNPALSATVLEHPLPPGCLPGACTIRSFLQMPELSPEPISTNY